MNIKKTILLLATALLVCFLTTLLLLAILCSNESIWFANVFLDKVYVFELMPLYLLGIAYIDRFMNIPAIIRIGNRTKALFISLKRKWGFAFVYLCLWFILVNLITSIKFTYIYEKSVWDIINIFFRYFLGLILSSIIVEILSRSQNQHLAGNSYLCTNLLLALEVIGIVPEIRMNTRFKPSFIFSWIFNKDIWACVALIVIIILFLLYLFKVNAQKDML